MTPIEITIAALMFTVASVIIGATYHAVKTENERLERHADEWNLESFGVEDGTIGMRPISKDD